MSENFEFNIGEKVVDSVTGFKGKVVSRTQHLGGSNQYLVQPLLNQCGDWIEARWFDRGRLLLQLQHEPIVPSN